MKLKLLNIVLLVSVFACSTTNITYNPKEFDTVNYQKNVENAVDAADILNDFDTSNIPQANLEPADFSNLVQADIYFNQGDYLKAYNYYKQLSIKYKDPRIVYKAIVCLEHFSSTNEQIAELNSMINLFIKITPDSQLAKLFQIKVALNQNNLSLAQDNLDGLMDKHPQNGRAILLFVSSLLTGDLKTAKAETLTKFGDYVIDNYKVYPEANLVASINYATADDMVNLTNRLDLTQKKFPNWDVPVIWSASILLHTGSESEVISILNNNLKNNPEPSSILQNMYTGALLKSGQLPKAQDYTALSIQNNLNKNNALINMGIIKAMQNDYNSALTDFTAVDLADRIQSSVVKLAAASIYDYQGNRQQAIKYYQEVANLNQYLTTPADLMILSDYAAMGNKLKTDQMLYDFAKNEKLDAKKTILLKAGFYIDMNWYGDAYKLLDANYAAYSGDKDYVYTYASMAAMTQNTKHAIKLYKKYIKMDSGNAMGYNDLAFIYADQTRDYKQAYIYASKAFQLNPTDPNILDTYGWVYYRLANYPLALKYVKASVDKSYNPDSAEHLKAIYMALKQPEQAAKVIIVNKKDIQANIKRQLLDKAIGLLIYIQFGIEVKPQ